MARQSPVAVAGFNLAVAGLPSFCQPSPRCCPRRRSCSPQNLKCFASNPQNLFGGRLRQRQNTSINQTLFAVCKYGGKASRFTGLNSERSNELPRISIADQVDNLQMSMLSPTDSIPQHHSRPCHHIRRERESVRNDSQSGMIVAARFQFERRRRDWAGGKKIFEKCGAN